MIVDCPTYKVVREPRRRDYVGMCAKDYKQQKMEQAETTAQLTVSCVTAPPPHSQREWGEESSLLWFLWTRTVEGLMDMRRWRLACILTGAS